MLCLRRHWLIAVCAALVACADGTGHRDVAAPDDELVLALTQPAGDRVFPLVLGASRTDVLRAPSLRGKSFATPTASAKVAGTARGNGNVDITYLGSQQTYSFSAQTVGMPPGALGTVQVSIVNPAYTMSIDATIDCVFASGNEAWISGPVTQFVFNGVVRPATIHLLFMVQDNGEGASAPPDLVTAPFGAGPQACASAPVLPMQPNGAGTVKLMVR